MADQQVNYIQQMLAQNVDVTVIRRNLIQAGYTLNEIDQAIGQVVQQRANAPNDQNNSGNYPNNYPDNSYDPIASYIVQFLQKGYNLTDIRTYLLRYYPQQQIDPVIASFLEQQTKRKAMKIVFSLFFIVIFALVLGFLMYFFLLPQSTSEKINFSYSLKENVLQQGALLSFTIHNIPAERKENMQLFYRIIDQQTNTVVREWETKITADDVFEAQQTYQLPTDFEVGNYNLLIKVTYGKIKEEDSHKFRVIIATSQASCFDGIKNQNEQAADCGGVCKKCETCFDNIQNQDEEAIDCGGICLQQCSAKSTATTTTAQQQLSKSQTTTVKSTAEKEQPFSSSDVANDNLLFDKAEKKVAEDPQQAAALCTQIISRTRAEECLFQVAKSNQTIDFCREIETTKKRDSCYMYFVTNYNDFVCDQISNEEFKNICISLQQLDEYKKAQKLAEQQGTPFVYGNFTIIEDNESVNTMQPAIVINDVTKTTVNETTAAINWKTNVAADSLVKYGLQETNLDQQQYNSSITYTHTILLSDLISNNYFFVANSSNSFNSTESQVYSFVFP